MRLTFLFQKTKIYLEVQFEKGASKNLKTKSMKKKLLSERFFQSIHVKKFKRTMKLTLLAVFLLCMQLSAKVYSQKDVKLSFDIKKIKLAEALEKIEVASGCRFFYNARQIPLNTIVPLTTKGSESIPHILTSMLASVNLN